MSISLEQLTEILAKTGISSSLEEDILTAAKYVVTPFEENKEESTCEEDNEELTFEEACITDEEHLCEHEIEGDEEGISSDQNEEVDHAYESRIEHWFQGNVLLLCKWLPVKKVEAPKNKACKLLEAQPFPLPYPFMIWPCSPPHVLSFRCELLLSSLAKNDHRKGEENHGYMAKLAEQAEQYDEMVDSMKKVAKLDIELTVEERNLLSVGFMYQSRDCMGSGYAHKLSGSPLWLEVARYLKEKLGKLYEVRDP